MKKVFFLAIAILLAAGGAFVFFYGSISQIGTADATSAEPSPRSGASAFSAENAEDASTPSLSSMAGAMPTATRVDPSEDVFKVMGIRSVTEAEQAAFRKEMEEIRQANENREKAPIEIDVKQIKPGKYKMADEGLVPVDPDDEDPGLIMVVPEPASDDR